MASVPDIAYGVPEQERETTRHIEMQLSALDSFIGDFQSALGLFDFCLSQEAPLERQLANMVVPEQGNSQLDQYDSIQNYFREKRLIDNRIRVFMSGDRLPFEMAR